MKLYVNGASRIFGFTSWVLEVSLHGNDYIPSNRGPFRQTSTQHIHYPIFKISVNGA